MRLDFNEIRDPETGERCDIVHEEYTEECGKGLMTTKRHYYQIEDTHDREEKAYVNEWTPMSQIWDKRYTITEYYSKQKKQNRKWGGTIN